VIHKHSTTAIGLLASALAWGIVVPAGTASAAPAGTQPPTSTVTLFTGDKILLGGSHHATVLPAKGREHTRFFEQTDEFGDIHVVPEDAVPLLRTKRMDPRLFNVTKLVQNGYGDSARADIPLIVSGSGLAAAKVRDLPSINGAAVRVDKAAGLKSFASAQRIWLDGPVQATLDKSVPQIGAPEAWKAGYTGKDTTIAVLDTGIDAAHPDLTGAVADAQDFTASATGVDDYFGHGTHVASTITGQHEKYTGVAPDTKLLNGKVLGDGGNGAESWIIAGMEWATGKGARVVNMSLGSPFPSDGTDALSLAVNRLTAQTGSLFVVAAGNSGGLPGGPAAADAALTVGAVDHNEQLAPFSSRGPRAGDGAIKPDITAPGVDITAAKATHGRIGTPVDATHVSLSGTSMATPHVAGAAAILAGQHPDWKADQLKATLMGSAKANPALSVFEQGAGRVDVAKAVSQNVYASPSSLSEGVAQWPHNDDQPITRTLTYHNSGSAPVTLNLTTDVHDPAGKPAPAGMFTVSPAALTIPAGGEASAVVTSDTRVNGPDGTYNGAVLAGDIRTPLAVTREVESYNVTMKFVGFDGKPTPDYSFSFVDLDRPHAYGEYDSSGTVVARLPKGRFYLDSWVQNVEERRLATAVEPEYTVTGDATMTVDARDAKEVGFVLDKPNAKPGQAVVGFERTDGPGSNYFVNNFDGFTVRPSTTSSAQFRFVAEARMAEPDARGRFDSSPYLYNVRREVPAKVPADLVQRVTDNRLAKVRSDFAATTAGKFGMRENMIAKPLPYSLDEFYTPDVPMDGLFMQVPNPDTFDAESSQWVRVPRAFKLGQSTERWNYGVFGPSLPSYDPRLIPNRTGDQLRIEVPMYTDQGGRGRYGTSPSTGTTTLYRDGTQIATSPTPGFGVFTVPPAVSSYRAHTEAIQDTPLSSKVIVDWTFRSSTVTGPEALPLMAIRFVPALDNQNRAPRAVPSVVSVNVEHNAGGQAKSLAVQVSYDSGTTWKPAPVLTVGGRTFTVLVHPSGAKSVSLKASAADKDGNTVEQTIIGAFTLK
jgi:subtilisin family serine protease